MELSMPDAVVTRLPREKKKKGRATKAKLKHTMTALVEMRWDATRADEHQIRDRYGAKLTVEEALAELARLRRLCEMAAYEINQRLNHVDQKCASCGNLMDGRRPPTMIEPVRDLDTGTMSNNYYCSILCVQKRNLRKLGRQDSIK